jgi:alkylation response protein AidB-like acyl-CoA dehydrogenase
MTPHAQDLEAFRADVRAWLGANVPPNWRETVAASSDESFRRFQLEWLETLRSGGLLAPEWPVEYGGPGLSPEQQIVVHEEMARYPAPRLGLYIVSLYHVFHTLVAFGTEEQKAQHLPAILQGEIWCQGFSEPSAGSDLASLRTRAVREGDEYVVNGQKVWSSYAMDASWCILLVRTDPEASKTHGITFLLMDMKSPGITVKPIKQATGNQEFNEIFLDDVRIPVSNRVGEENQGWQIAQVTLSAERGPGAIEMAERLGAIVERLRKETVLRFGGADRVPAELARSLVGYWTRAQLLREMCVGMLLNPGASPAGDYESSVFKLVFASTLQALLHEMLEFADQDTFFAADPLRGEGFDSRNLLLDYLGSYEWTIAGGTNDIQRNLISERVLGLPREARW